MIYKPTFDTWSRDNLNKYALEAFDAIIDLQDKNEALHKQLSEQKEKYLDRIKVLLADRDRLLEFHRVTSNTQ